MNGAKATFFLMVRSLREAVRQPSVELANVLVPLFFFAVAVGSIGSVSGRAFGVANYTGFQVPVAILQAAASAAGASGLGMVTDIERGYFDKLLLTPAPRLALVLGRVASDGVRAMVLTAFVLVAGAIAGAGMATGPLGYIVTLLLAGGFGVAYAGVSVAIALKTGSPQAAQSGFLFFFLLLFLSPAFAPKEIFDGWLKLLASINPVTYIIEGMRDVILKGWDAGSLLRAVASIAGMAAVTWSLMLAALRSRAS